MDATPTVWTNAVMIMNTINKITSLRSEEVRSKLPLDNKVTYEPIPSKEYPSGMKGRMCVMEALIVDRDMEHLILTNPVEPELHKLARSKGMITLREDAIIKALEGMTTLQEAFMV